MYTSKVIDQNVPKRNIFLIDLGPKYVCVNSTVCWILSWYSNSVSSLAEF